MKNLKKILAGGTLILTFAVTSVTSLAASSYQTPAEAVAGVTGMTLEEVRTERDSGKSYGRIAADEGKLKEYQKAILEMQKDWLDEKVADGTITQEQADAELAAIEKRQSVCDGTGNGNCGLGYGRGNRGGGNGRGNGRGMRNGNCYY